MLKKHGWKKSSEFDVIGKKTFYTLIQISTVAYGPLNLSDTYKLSHAIRSRKISSLRKLLFDI